MDVYEMVTQRIIEQMEEGVVPWRKPWVNGLAKNWLTQKPYRGINTMILEPGEYATFKQIQKAGGKVKKGSKGSIVVFWKWLLKEDEETGEEKKIPFLRYYKVFDVKTQVEGLELKEEHQEFEHDPIEEAENIVTKYEDKPEIHYKSGRAVYSPTLDYISVPPMKDYPNVNEYYSTLFHEMAHSTGHKSRLDRDNMHKVVAFGSEDYSKEELVAELSAAMLCGVAGIDNSTLPQSASYLQSWLNKLKDDKRLLVSAAAKAQKASDYILGVEF